jgi:hypothetical protein
MNLRRRWLQIFPFVALLAVSLILSGTVLAQSTNRQIGTQFTVTADPLVQRPLEQPCVVPLFADYQFAYFSQWQQTFAFAPPGNCPGPWEKVVFEADFSENGGIQYDRSAIIFLGDTDLYFGTTPEPLATLTNTWHVERDVTDYSALLATPQNGDIELGNCTTDCSTYLTGVLTVSADLEFYPAQRRRSDKKLPDVVLPLVQTNSNGGINLPGYVYTPTDQLSTTFTLPTNIERAYLDVVSQSQNVDETWWGCLPNNLASINEAYGCGNTNFRETEVTIDGQPAGVAPVSPWVYTGDLPDDWMPTPGVQTLEFVPYRVNLTPFASLLSNGQPHTIAFSVFNNDYYYEVTGSLLLYLDQGSTQITGAVTENTLTVPNPVITEKLHGTGTVKGTIGVQSNRNYTIAGYVNTSHGMVSTSIAQQQNFSSTERIDFDTVNYTVLDQNTSIQTSLSTQTTVSNTAGTTVTSDKWSFPFTVRFTYPVSSAMFGFTEAFTQDYGTSELVTFNGTPTYFNSLTNALKATDASPLASSQKYTYFDSNGVSYECRIASENAVLTAVDRGCKQSQY